MASDAIGFWDYLDTYLRSMHLKAGHGGHIDTGEVGDFGYWLAVIDFIGFILGGFFVFFMLQTYPTCWKCSRYLRKITKTGQMFPDHEQFGKYYDTLFQHPVDSKPFADLMKGNPKVRKPTLDTVLIGSDLLGCAHCKTQLLTQKVQILGKKGWKDIPKLTRNVRLPDGVDLRQYDPADLRRGIGFVLQDIELVFGRLRDNIALGLPSATDEQVLEAARLAGVEQFAANHPLGYDLIIAEGGRSLSGGQKQAIGLARALIRKPQILFLDEPTAHFDTRSEAEFLDRLKLLARSNMTILVSTHRMSLLSLVDRLLVFEQGRLVADGPRDQVIAMLQGAGRGPTLQPQAPVATNAAV